MNNTIDEELIKNDKSGLGNLKDAISWWENKRVWFNILVGICGVIPLLPVMARLSLFDLIGVAFWAALANILYSLGELLEMWNFHYLDSKISFKSLRLLFFLLGTGLYCLVTIFYSAVYFYQVM